MKKYHLKPDEYVSFSSLDTLPTNLDFYVSNGLVIKKDGKETIVKTISPVDDGCEIEVTIKKNGYGKVKYIKSTFRRKYYFGLTLYIVALQLLSIIFCIYDLFVLKNNTVTNPNTDNILLPTLVTWLTIDIIVLRDAKGFTKVVITGFSYFTLLLSTISFITYIINLF